MATATKINNQTTIVNMAPLLAALSLLKKEVGQELEQGNDISGELDSKIDSILKENDVKTVKEKVDDLSNIISKSSIKNGTEIGILAKKIEVATEKLIAEYPKEVEELRKEDFKDNFDKELKEKNSNLSEDQIKSAGEYRDLVAKNSFKESIIDGQQNEALEKNSQLGPGKLENAWTDLKTTVNFLQKSPEEIKNIKEKYNSLKGKLEGINLPNGSKEARSFERIMSVFNNPNTDDLFSRTKKYLGWADRVDKLTGGWLNKTVTDAGLKVVEKIGNQAVQEFATNALGTIAEQGFQKGFTTVLNGVLSGGVQATATTAGTAAATGAGTAAAATAGGAAATGTAAATGAAAASATVPVVGWIVAAAIVVLGAVKKVGNAIAEKLGISTKAFFEEKFGKVGGFLVKGAISLVAVPVALVGAITAVTVGPIIIAVVIGLFGYNMFTTNQMASSVVPPKGATNTTTVEIPVASGENYTTTGGCSTENTKQYLGQIGIATNQYGVKLAVFEKEGGKRATQYYDVGCIDNGKWLEKVPNQHVLLDKRVIPAYIAMVTQAGKDGISADYFEIVDGYRSLATQTEAWNSALIKAKKYAYANGINISGMSDYDVIRLVRSPLAPPGKSIHMSGRALDMTNLVAGNAGFNWMVNNGWKFGFYNFKLENWHWEYNPKNQAII